MSQNKGKVFTIQGALEDISIANTGSGQASIPANLDRNFLMIANPQAVTIGANFAGGTASVGSAGTTPIAAGGNITFQNGFIPTNLITVCGTSGGGGVSVYQG